MQGGGVHEQRSLSAHARATCLCVCINLCLHSSLSAFSSFRKACQPLKHPSFLCLDGRSIILLGATAKPSIEELDSAAWLRRRWQ